MRIHDVFATKEDKKRLPEIKGPETKNFTKDDFLSATKLVNKLGLPKEVIEKAMRDMRFKQTKVIVHNHKTDVVIKNKSGTLLLHPIGLSVFQEYILKQNGESK